MLLATILIFLGLLLVLVLVHEWGHFIVAKKAGCTVEEFGFGFPPRVFGRMWHGTLYSLNLLPLGGFVKIQGEDMDDPNPSATSFASKSAPWRIAILCAGVAMNMLLAIVLLGIQSGLGSPTVVTNENRARLTNIMTYVLEVAPDSPAAQAGLMQYDRIVRYADTQQPGVADIQSLTKTHAGVPTTLEIERAGQHITLDITARANPPEGQGALGISLGETGLHTTVWWKAPWEGAKRTWEMTVGITSQFAGLIQKLFQKESVGQVLTGPIGIAIYTREAASLGISYFLEFAAMISINLAIINILPLPALDGGRVLFVIIEKAIGRRVPGKVESYAHTTGFLLLIGLMIAITFKDIARYF
ncbi:MAG: hypothetical protein A3C02_03195 [Candidatus Andersenbacteria bacterium RIFCSPHIGHO2_02_FULL_45_11]|uniref:Peptidase M50 domain-containing protein n=1 Tax=Candidatus Andersenbacteria bacterium RIFCSPHIGHO2_12_FULL_45_11 TaxID=1797281 RepID=A0A1G1X565_9BACT|nr:MAG: hypothetical protein A2805_01860 [Candidatus Andersenbacteria bacterium RIFCSPHIGHO2_01_FULL_46_36]OGY34024.1 MAG: hypothetical protein A3C02_03195 [Candidatus Andersenbacteria bacterium RIFCSPHIGHO2_02_FULL_45_11]OGY35148.1 MAG: hypothetical protein A3D99_00165 [Candidatus Andersenbacteria bacterium RIFCSPHIGHO2_12_FULL_45_11]QBM02246.1 regulator of sigma-W protease RasP [uncultured archaeon]